MDAVAKKNVFSTVTNIALLVAFGIFILNYILREFVPERAPQPKSTVTQMRVQPAPIPAPQETTPAYATPVADIIMPHLGQNLSISTTPNNTITKEVALIAPTLNQELQQTPPDDSANTRKGNASDEDIIDLSTKSEHDFGQHAFSTAERFSASFIKRGLWGSNE